MKIVKDIFDYLNLLAPVGLKIALTMSAYSLAVPKRRQEIVCLLLI